MRAVRMRQLVDRTSLQLSTRDVRKGSRSSWIIFWSEIIEMISVSYFWRPVVHAFCIVKVFPRHAVFIRKSVIFLFTSYLCQSVKRKIYCFI